MNPAAPSPQTSEIFAQVGRLLKSDQTPLPARGRAQRLDVGCHERFVRGRCKRRAGVTLYMTGHSMSAGPSWTNMDTAHEQLRLEDGAPIRRFLPGDLPDGGSDGALPTCNEGRRPGCAAPVRR
jgi:hypothetical protein